VRSCLVLLCPVWHLHCMGDDEAWGNTFGRLVCYLEACTAYIHRQSKTCRADMLGWIVTAVIHDATLHKRPWKGAREGGWDIRASVAREAEATWPAFQPQTPNTTAGQTRKLSGHISTHSDWRFTMYQAEKMIWIHAPRCRGLLQMESNW
jgi:hypothetical protein